MSVTRSSPKEKARIWIDLDNSPHVVFFRPIKAELEKRGYDVLLTARKCFQVCELADRLNLEYRSIGKHYGKNKLMKVLGLAVRSARLLPFAFRSRPTLAVSHGSRAQMLASKLLGIPSVLIFDYEHTHGLFQIHPTWLVAPEILGSGKTSFKKGRLLLYPGIKEDVYVPGFTPEEGIRRELGVSEQELLATIRPPATEANYHSHDSDILFSAIVEHLAKCGNVRMVMLPRNDRQKAELERAWPGLFSSGKILVPRKVVDGLNLIWHSDMIFSGGGTMNREAAALNAPVYSFFRGKLGAIDRYLAGSGRLKLIENEADIRSIKIERWQHPKDPDPADNRSLMKLVDIITSIASERASLKAPYGLQR